MQDDISFGGARLVDLDGCSDRREVSIDDLRLPEKLTNLRLTLERIPESRMSKVISIVNW